jgi:hypothetical protein
MRRPLFLLALVMAPLAARAQNAPPPADTAKLTFNWPATVRARVDAQRYRERVSNGKHDTSDVRLSYRMTAQRTGNEYVVRFSDFQMPQAPGGVRSSEAAFVERLGGIAPSYRVNASGEFTGLESPAVIRAFVDSMLNSLTAKDGPPAPEMKQFLRTMLSDEVLAASAAQEWNALVGTWLGAELEVGQAYGTEGEEPVPIFQNATVKFEYEFAALRRMPCDSVASPAARDCVELQMVSRPDSAAMRQMLQRFMSTLVPDAAQDMGFADFDVENVVTLVARPESLLPVSLVVTKEVTGTVREKGKTEKVYQYDVKSQRYTYQR